MSRNHTRHAEFSDSKPPTEFPDLKIAQVTDVETAEGAEHEQRHTACRPSHYEPEACDRAVGLMATGLIARRDGQR